VTPVQIFYGLKEIEGSARPYALTVVLLAVSIAVYVVGKLLFGGRGYAMSTRASRAASEAPLKGSLVGRRRRGLRRCRSWRWCRISGWC
jgi:iron(III) transport system permease protein